MTTKEGDVVVESGVEEVEVIKETTGGDVGKITIALPIKESKEDKSKRMRIKVLEEIVTTEKAYVHDLNFIMKHFVGPSKKLISEEDANIIYSNIATIQSVHQTIYASLSERVWGSIVSLPSPVVPSSLPPHIQDEKEGSEGASSPRKAHSDKKVENDFLIADIFVKNADYLKFYTTYTLNQSESLQAIRRLKQNSVTFNAFLRGMQNKKTDIGSYLIKPVQRICKYPLLLRELLKYTPSSHPDHECLLQALDKVQAVATHVDVHNQRVQNIAKMMEIQRSLILGKGIKFDVVKPSRVFIQEGDFISIKQGTQKGGKTVRVFLFNDVLVISNKGKEHKNEAKTDDTGQLVSGATYTFQVRFSLKLTQVRELDKPGLLNAFELLQPQMLGAGKKTRGSLKGSSSMILQAESLVEKQKWVLAINKCKKELQAKIIAQIQATSDSKKNRASTLIGQLHLKRDDDEGANDEDSASETSYSPRESPRQSRASLSLDSIDENSASTQASTLSKGEVQQKNPLLSVPMSRSLPASPTGSARRRSSSYSQLAITPQILQKEREKEKEEKDRDKEKEKKKKERKEKKKKKEKALQEYSATEEDADYAGGSGETSTKKKKAIRKDLFQEDSESTGGNSSGEEEKPHKKSKKESAKTKHIKDRARSRSFTQLPTLNKIDLKSSDSAPSVPVNPNSSPAPSTPNTSGEGLKIRSVAFKRHDSADGGSKLLPSHPTRRKASMELQSDGDSEEEDEVAALRLKLAEMRLKKNKWKERYSVLKVKYEDLEKRAARDAAAKSLSSSLKEGGACESGGSSEGGSKKSSPREGVINDTMENLARALAGMSAEGEPSLDVQEREMQLLLAQRKNELEEKKRMLESKRKELEEKRRESAGLESS